MDDYLMISDAAKEVQVESHVLRYWEEELHLPIHRNELGHRYYTKEDVERFKQIKGMKERGLQLKAIKMILKDGKIDVMMPEEEKEALKQQEEVLEKKERQAETLEVQKAQALPDAKTAQDTGEVSDPREEKARRLQWLLQQMVKDTLQENNKELCRDIKESIVKELDYQFRVREEKEEERDRAREEREEEHYQKIDELLEAKSRKKNRKEEKQLEKARRAELKKQAEANKKKKPLFFSGKAGK